DIWWAGCGTQDYCSCPIREGRLVVCFTVTPLEVADRCLARPLNRECSCCDDVNVIAWHFVVLGC
ncbi:hypothetical protein COCCADRAFT_106419, partial [Bipolaris zeicola 26-R-13]